MNTAIVSHNPDTGRYEAMYNGERVASSASLNYFKYNQFIGTRKAKRLDVTQWKFAEGQGPVQVVKSAKEVKMEIAEEQSRFDINERFDFMSEAVKMVLNNTIASTIICGRGGLGKSYTVLEELDKAGLRRDFSVEGSVNTDYIIVKGASTPKALFGLLQRHNGKTIVFDDCDSVLKDTTSVNLLKSALDSYGDRWITWNAESNDDLERSFNFQGRIIFISNMPESKMDGAVISRSMVVDLSMTNEDVIARMRKILHDMDMPSNATTEHREDAMDWIEMYQDDIRDLNLRTLIKTVKIRATVSAEKWERMADYIAVGG